MSKESLVDNIRNLIIFLILFFLFWILIIYLSSIIFVLTENYKLITVNPYNSIKNFIPLLIAIEYGNWWINNFHAINASNINYYRYFTLRYSLSFFIPHIVYFFLLYKYKHRIYELRIFKENESLHGEARWATEEDIKKIGLRAKKGMLLGKDKNGFLIAGDYQHALLFAPTGSGKGVGFVIPNLLYWEDSLFVHDIKLENYDITSGWRAKMGQKVFLWNPADPDGFTHCYNPIDWVSVKAGQMVDDVQKIANLIMPEKEFWHNEARSLFVGIVLYLIAAPDKNPSFGEVVRTIRSDDVVYNLAVVLDTLGNEIHPVAYMNLAAFLQKADKERSGVISTMNSSLELWSNPLIDTATASSDFNIQNFKKELTTVYVGLSPDNIQRLRPLMQVFYQQATEFLSRKMPSHDEPYGVMFMMDEFPTLGKMDQFSTGIAYFRGYHVRLFLITQDTEQLKGIYEEHGMNSFLSNTTFRITFAANNYATANLISQMCGNKTVEQVSSSRPKFFNFNPSSNSLSISQTQRALLLPQEVVALPRDEQILLIESSPPIKSMKIKYYEDKIFQSKMLPKVKMPQQAPFDIQEWKKSRESKNKEPINKNIDSNIDDQDSNDSNDGNDGNKDNNNDSISE